MKAHIIASQHANDFPTAIQLDEEPFVEVLLCAEKKNLSAVSRVTVMWGLEDRWEFGSTFFSSG